MISLGELNVGDIVKVKENGDAEEYLIVHKGLPAEIYDESCDGVWLLRKYAWDGSQMAWHTNIGSKNDCSYLINNINVVRAGANYYINKFDLKTQAIMKSVKIPYRPGYGTSKKVNSGNSGLPCKLFILSAYEYGWTVSDNQNLSEDGAKLDYFLHSNDEGASVLRKATYATGNAAFCWTRSPDCSGDNCFIRVNNDGSYHSSLAGSSCAIRPAFILSHDVLVDDDGVIFVNVPPTITADKSGDIGTITNGFNCEYTISDMDEEDELTVTLYTDGVETNQFTAINGETEVYTLSGTDWLKTANGLHTFTINCSDGYASTDYSIEYSRECNSLSLSLADPIEAVDKINAYYLAIEGYIPDDAKINCEITNNAKDTNPVWEDCSASIKEKQPYYFNNKAAENGFALNFRLQIQRGDSGEGGYITKISGGGE